jgi:mono/diheme cytochrome c family protein
VGSVDGRERGDADAREPDARAEDARPAGDWARAQLARNAATAALVFAALAAYAAYTHAPLGPPADASPPGYLPRPGAQFLWLFQMLKYLPPAAASLAALLVPGLFLAALALLPFAAPRETRDEPRSALRRLLASRPFGASVFALLFLVVAGLTAAARIGDARDPRVSEQLARQRLDEEVFLSAPFTPRATGVPDATGGGDGAADPGGAAQSAAGAASLSPPPAAYTQQCARCHGDRGGGRGVNPHLIGLGSRPNRTAADIVRILDDPASYNLLERMPSFKTKLTADEKRAIADWLVSLKAAPN